MNKMNIIDMIQDKPKEKLDYLVARGYITKYKEYCNFNEIVFLIDNELYLMRKSNLTNLTSYINIDMLIEEELEDFCNA